MNTQLPLNQRIDKTKLEKHPSGDGWLVPMRNGERAWVFTFGATEYFAYPIRGLGENWSPEGFVYNKENPNGCDLMLDAYVDPYAELKAAHAAGKVIQWTTRGLESWTDCPDWTLGRSVNGFTLGDGQEWHRNDFKEKQLLPPYRPLLFDEEGVSGIDEYAMNEVDSFHIQEFASQETVESCKGAGFWRTRRPLPPVKKMVQLGPEDVTCGDVLSIGSHPRCSWLIIAVETLGIRTFAGFMTWSQLKDRDYKISRDGGKTWEVCSKWSA